jgi:hypothetical protein
VPFGKDLAVEMNAGAVGKGSVLEPFGLVAVVQKVYVFVDVIGEIGISCGASPRESFAESVTGRVFPDEFDGGLHARFSGGL